MSRSGSDQDLPKAGSAGQSPSDPDAPRPRAQAVAPDLPKAPLAIDLFELSNTSGTRGAEDLRLFAGRSRYRRRRLVDAARVLPVLGLFLWWLPLLWGVPEEKHSASGALIYLFAVWGGLILVSGLLFMALGRGADPASAKGQGPFERGAPHSPRQETRP